MPQKFGLKQCASSFPAASDFSITNKCVTSIVNNNINVAKLGQVSFGAASIEETEEASSASLRILAPYEASKF